ncbi:MAG TPA: hypothetical protein VFR35_11945 [Actinoplanes sp.]|nr:hypothetical protein [Actinoplanes sp.]
MEGTFGPGSEAIMAESDPVAASAIAVQRGVWADPVLAEMVAPPVIVSSLPVVERPAGTWRRGQLARSRGNMPVGRHRGRTR